MAVGTHPDQQTDPAMPDPARQVQKSYRLLRHMGFSHQNSYIAVEAVARECARNLRNIGVENTDWLEQVANLAAERVGPITPSQSSSPGSEHADGTSGRTGRTGQDRDPASQG